MLQKKTKSAFKLNLEATAHYDRMFCSSENIKRNKENWMICIVIYRNCSNSFTQANQWWVQWTIWSNITLISVNLQQKDGTSAAGSKFDGTGDTKDFILYFIYAVSTNPHTGYTRKHYVHKIYFADNRGRSFKKLDCMGLRLKIKVSCKTLTYL